MDMVSRYDPKTFAVSVQYADPEVFNPELFQRLIDNIRRHTLRTSEQGKQLQISIGIWYGHDMDPAPTADDIIERAQKASK